MFIVDFLKRFVLHKNGNEILRKLWTVNEMISEDFLKYVENDPKMKEEDKMVRYHAVIAAKNALEELMKLV